MQHRVGGLHIDQRTRGGRVVVGRPAPGAGARARDAQLLQCAGVAQAVAAEAVLVQQVQHRVLADRQCERRYRCTERRQEHHAARAEVGVLVVQRVVVARREGRQRVAQAGRQREHALAVVAAALVGIEVAVAGDGVDAARRVDRRTEARAPDARQLVARRIVDGVERRLQLQAGRIAQHPAGDVAGVVVAVRADADVDRVAAPGERRAAPLVLRIEAYRRTVGHLCRRRQIDRRDHVAAVGQAQAVDRVAERAGRRLGRGDQVDRRLGGRFAHDHRRARDAGLGDHVAATHVGRLLRRPEVALPQQRIVLRVVRIDAVVAGRDDQHVVEGRGVAAARREREARHEQRLRQHVAIDVQRRQQAEVARCDVGRRQHGLGLVPAGAQRVVVEGRHVDAGTGERPLERGLGVRMQRRRPVHAAGRIGAHRRVVVERLAVRTKDGRLGGPRHRGRHQDRGSTQRDHAIDADHLRFSFAVHVVVLEIASSRHPCRRAAASGADSPCG